MREKLIELVEQGYKKYFNPNWAGDFFGSIADHLIANDVVPVVRCRDCKHYIPFDNECEEPHNHYTEDGFREVHDNDFCSYGERKDNG